MASERQRLLELALESLEHKKKQIDAEIAQIAGELKGKPVKLSSAANAKALRPSKKRGRFSKEERLKRSQRMKAYWANWRKHNSKAE